MEREALLRLLRLKGYVRPGPAGPDPRAAEGLVAEGLAEASTLGLRLTPQGQAAADALWAAERAQIPPDAIEAIHEQFLLINPLFKQLVGEWQQGGEDEALIARLRATHEGLGAILARLTGLLPRCSRYAPAFDAALAEVERGNRRYLAAPLIESYHTLWFELHEELIRLSGRTRADEAARGRAS